MGGPPGKHAKWTNMTTSFFSLLEQTSSLFSLTEFPPSFYVPQIESYIKESMKAEMAQLQQSAVHNHTAAMLQMGTNLLSQTAEQTRKLTDVETQVTPPERHARCKM